MCVCGAPECKRNKTYVPILTLYSLCFQVIVEGLSQFQTQDIRADVAERTLKLKIKVPVIRIRGYYRAEGKVVVVTLNGNGPFTAVLHDAVGEGFGRIVAVGPPNNRSLSIRDTNIDFKIGRVNITLNNLFDGKLPALAKTTNDFLNLNSEMIINEVKPQIKFEVSRLFESVMDDAFSELPVEEFLNSLPSKQRPRSNRGSRSGRFLPPNQRSIPRSFGSRSSFH